MRVDWYHFINWGHILICCLSCNNVNIALVYTPSFPLLEEPYSNIVCEFYSVFFEYVYVKFSEALKALGLFVQCCLWVVRVAHGHVLSNRTTPPACKLEINTTSWWLFVKFIVFTLDKILMQIFNTHMYISY